MFAGGTGSRHLVPTSGVRDPPPYPLPDGAPPGAVGACGARSAAACRPPDGQHTLETADRTDEGALDRDEIGGDVLALVGGGGIGQRSDAARDLVQ